MNSRKPIQHIIYHEYLKAALIPILIVEFMLLVICFAITGIYNPYSSSRKSRRAVKNRWERFYRFFYGRRIKF